MSYGRTFSGLGAWAAATAPVATQDPPPATYIQGLLSTIAGLQGALSSCQAGTAGAAAGCAQGMNNLNQQIASYKNTIDELTNTNRGLQTSLSSCQAGAGGAAAGCAQGMAALQAQLDAANARHCRWWLYALIGTAVGATAMKLTKKKSPKPKELTK